jgi:6-phosphogluconolactonase (cycloisomerase 2 family)
MKFSKLSQLFLVSSIGLLVATLLTACQIVTIDYVFVASSAGLGTSGDGQIDTYAVDSESGALRTGAPSVSSGGVNPVSMAVTSDYANLYVANKTSSTVAHFTIGVNGVLTAKDTITTSNSPVAMAVDTAGKYLYVVSGPTPAVVTAYPLSSGTIGTAVSQQTFSLAGYGSDILAPTGIAVLANTTAIPGNGIYVTLYDQSAYNPGGTTGSTANPGWIFGFTAGSGGALTPISGSPWKAGIKPSAVAADPTDRFVYVTDYANNQLIGYTIQDGSVLSFMINGPFSTASEPSAIVVDPRGKYIYVANALSATVSAYAIDLPTGTPSAAVNTTGSATNSTDPEPVAIVIDPSLGRFVYTANLLGNSVSGFQLNPNAGTLTATQSTPYPTADRPAALVVVPHGNHAIQTVAP